MLHGKVIKIPNFHKARVILCRKFPEKYHDNDGINVCGTNSVIWNRHFGDQPVTVLLLPKMGLDGRIHSYYSIQSVATSGSWHVEPAELEALVNARKMPNNFTGETQGVIGRGI